MKLNLIIDASGLFYRSLFTVGNYGSKGKLLGTEASKGVFIRKIATDISSFIRSVDGLSRVMFAVDSNSWRKKVDIEEGGYKSSRTKSEDTDWTAFYECCDLLIEQFRKRGYTILKADNAEADDLLFLSSRKLNALGENVILGTGDKDMFQTACVNDNGTYTIILDPVNNRRKVSLTQETLDLSKKVENPDEFDIFESDFDSSNDSSLRAVINKESLNIIDPEQCKVLKIIMGDLGDYVPGIITWPKKSKTAKEGDWSTFSETAVNKILTAYPIKNWKELYNLDLKDSFYDILREVSKTDWKNDKIKERIKRNCKLVVLDEEVIPSDIQKAFDEIEFTGNVAYSSKEQILEGTNYFSNDYDAAPKSYSLF